MLKVWFHLTMYLHQKLIGAAPLSPSCYFSADSIEFCEWHEMRTSTNIVAFPQCAFILPYFMAAKHGHAQKTFGIRWFHHQKKVYSSAGNSIMWTHLNDHQESMISIYRPHNDIRLRSSRHDQRTSWQNIYRSLLRIRGWRHPRTAMSHVGLPSQNFPSHLRFDTCSWGPNMLSSEGEVQK